MEKQTTNILVTLNQNYLPQLKVMLTSLFFNSPGNYGLYLLHRSIPDAELSWLEDGL